MDELYNKDKEEAEYSEESKTIINTLIECYFKNNDIRFTLTDIMNIEEKSTKQRRMM